jgi:hypothetical protein
MMQNKEMTGDIVTPKSLNMNVRRRKRAAQLD